VVASSCIDQTLRHAIETALGPEPLRILEQSPKGISVVLDPTGTPLGKELCRDEGILYAEIDLVQSVEPKQFHDVVGSYNRFDIFALSVDRSARRPARFIDEARDSADSKIPLRTGGPRRRLTDLVDRGKHRGSQASMSGSADCSGTWAGTSAFLLRPLSLGASS
jgi:hypothetical protein